jgi:hypothetical protein
LADVSARRPTHAKRPKRPPLTPEQRELAHAIAARVGDLQEAGSGWDNILIDLDKTWPHLPFRLAVAGLFLAEEAHQRRQQGRLQ